MAANASTVKVTFLGDATQLSRAAQTATGSMDKLSKRAKLMGAALGGAIGAGAAIGLGKLKSFATGAVDVFAAVEDATGAAGVVFGKQASEITKFASTAGKAFGLTEREALDAALDFGTMGKAAGKTGADLTAFSTQFAGLAADMASFRGTTAEEAVIAVGAAMRGEMEPIRKYGVLLDDASLRDEALRQGLIKTTKEALTPQQKTLAASALILKQTADAQGDFNRTADSTANTQKTLAAETEKAQRALGQKLAPAITFLRQQLLRFVQWTTLGIEVLSSAFAVARGLLMELAGSFRTGEVWAKGFRGLLQNIASLAGVAFQAASKAISDFIAGWRGDNPGTLLGDFGAAAKAAFLAAKKAVQDFAAGWRGENVEGMFARLGAAARIAFEAIKRGIRDFVAGLRGSDIGGFWNELGLTVRRVAEDIVAAIRFVITHWRKFAVAALVAAALIIPTLLLLAATAIKSAALQVAAWVSAMVWSITSAYVQMRSALIAAAAWVLMGFKAVINAMKVVGAYLLMRGGALMMLATWLVVVARAIAAWVAMAVGAMVNAVRVAAAWLVTQLAAIRAGIIHAAQVVMMIGRWVAMAVAAALNAARIAAAWVVTQVAAIRAGVIMAATALAVVAKWVAMRVAAVANAAMMAAAWLVAFGPVGWAILGLAALAAAFAVAWKTSEKFRNVVTAAVKATAGAALTAISAILGGLSNLLGLMGRLPGPFGAPFRGMQSSAQTAKAKVDAVRNAINAIPTRKTSTITVITRDVKISEAKRDATKARNNGARQHGGPVVGGRPYLVGEKGPELFTPSTSGRILNERQMAKAGAGSGNTYQLNVHGTLDSNLDERALEQMFRRMELAAGMGA